MTRNYRTRFGELDIVVSNAQTIVFVEVKTRRARQPGRQWENLHEAKRSQVRRIARVFLSDPTTGRPARRRIRFDAIGITIDPTGRLIDLQHLEGAF